MRYLKKYNESLYNDDPNVGEFIEKILSYKSNDFTNIRLRFKDWEKREGYPDRIAIDYTNNIIGEEESIILEYFSNALRLYINGTFYKDLPMQRVKSTSMTGVNNLFDSISEKSNNRKRHELETSLSKKILNGVNEEIIKGYFAEILEFTDTYNIEKKIMYKTETHWEIKMSIPGLLNIDDTGRRTKIKVTLDEKNTSIMESIMSISKTLRESEGLAMTLKIDDPKLQINLNAIDPSTGKILFNI